MIKKIALSLMPIVFLVGCGGDYNPDEDPREIYPTRVPVEGRDIPCVVYDDSDYEQGGISCDWSE